MAEKVILETQVVEGFAYNDNLGFYTKGASGWFDLEAGKTYRVAWDGETFTLNAYTKRFQGYERVFLGNEAYMKGESEDNTEPFLMYRVLANGYCCMASIDTETSHDVGIYEVVEDTPSEPETPEEPTEPEQQEGIILKDRNGEDVAYYGIETVTFDTTTEGKQQVFTKGTVVPRLEVPVTFANGDMVITADPDVSLRELVLQKPDTAAPENIRKDVNMCGLTGTFIGDTEEITVDLNMVNGDQVIVPTADGKVISKVTVKKPETMVAENIAEGVDIAGIIGTLVAGGNVKVTSGIAKVTTSAGTIVIDHGLGVVPDLFFAGNINDVAGSPGSRYIKTALGISKSLQSSFGWGYGATTWVTYESTNGSEWHTSTGTDFTGTNSSFLSEATDQKIKLGSSGYTAMNGHNFLWFAIGGLT